MVHCKSSPRVQGANRAEWSGFSRNDVPAELTGRLDVPREITRPRNFSRNLTFLMAAVAFSCGRPAALETRTIPGRIGSAREGVRSG